MILRLNKAPSNVRELISVLNKLPGDTRLSMTGMSSLAIAYDNKSNILLIDDECFIDTLIREEEQKQSVEAEHLLKLNQSKEWREMVAYASNSDMSYTYAGYSFVPCGRIIPGRTDDVILKSRTKLKLWDDYYTSHYNEQPKETYSPAKFYVAMNRAQSDFFYCDGRIYIPGEHELMEFCGYKRS